MSRPRIPRWHGRVSADGSRITLFARTLFQRWLGSQAGQLVTLLVEPMTQARSTRQNRYWWGSVVPAIAEACHYGPQEHHLVHEALCLRLLGLQRESHPALPLRVSSRTLTPADFNKFIEAAQLFAVEHLGLVIEDPDPARAHRRTDPHEKTAPDSRPAARHH